MAGVRWELHLTMDNKMGGGVFRMFTSVNREFILDQLEEYLHGNMIVDGAIEAYVLEIYPGNIPSEFETKIIAIALLN